MLFRVKDLKITATERFGLWGRKPIFELGPINFSVDEGETVAIIGANGSGKTLLAKSLVGAIKPDSGNIYLQNTLIDPLEVSRRAKNIRMIFQDSNESLNPGITVGSILSEPLKLNSQLDINECEERIEDILIKVGLLREHKYFYRDMLSFGQRQRVAIARALILEPKVIVADQPFAALDPSVRSQTINLLLSLQRELGLGFVVISHNLGIVRHICDKIVVLEKGKVVEAGHTEDVFNRPTSDYVRRLIQAHNGIASGI